jgi:hypothetical protein
VITLNDSVGARANRIQFWGWVSIGAALASIGSIIYGDVSAGDAQDQYKSTVNNSKRYDQLKGEFDTAKIFYYGGVAGVFLFTGGAIALFAVGSKMKKKTRASIFPTRASIFPTRGGALASFMWRW